MWLREIANIKWEHPIQGHILVTHIRTIHSSTFAHSRLWVMSQPKNWLMVQNKGKGESHLHSVLCLSNYLFKFLKPLTRCLKKIYNYCPKVISHELDQIKNSIYILKMLIINKKMNKLSQFLQPHRCSSIKIIQVFFANLACESFSRRISFLSMQRTFVSSCY